ncbi:MAG TPA: ATP-binding protein, partial [Steroidobacteraceae bacterium]|nr:ATP-binding protein [Steroidobacteraceae bacterium]
MRRLGRVIAAQRTFIADAAHELLTPLTALKLQTQMLARAESAQRQREATAELQGGVSRTLQLARQLLTLARHGLEAETRPEGSIDLAGLLRIVLAIHAPLAASKSIALELLAPADTVALRGQEEALQTLVSNLIENAIKYTSPSGRVRIRWQHAPGATTLEIEDSGPGIPPEERERVFDRFYRRPGELAAGNGLGLAIAREIAEHHGATISLEVSDELGGLAARVRFTRLDRPAARRRAA